MCDKIHCLENFPSWPNFELAFQEGINAITTDGGGVLIIPPGIFDINSSISYNLPDNITIKGAGKEVSIIDRKAGATTSLLIINGKNNIRLEDFSIHGFYSQAGFNIWVDNVDNLLINHIKSNTGASGLASTNNVSNTNKNITIKNSEFKGNKLTGISLVGENIIIDNNLSKDNGYVFKTHGMYLAGGKNYTISNNRFINNYDQGLNLYQSKSPAVSMTNFIVDNNYFENNGRIDGLTDQDEIKSAGGVMNIGTPNPVSGFKDCFIISNNIAKNNVNGISIKSTYNVQVVNNIIRNSVLSSGFQLSIGDDIGITMNANISNNLIENGQGTGVRIGFLSSTNALGVQLKNNIIRNNQVGIDKNSVSGYVVKPMFIIENDLNNSINIHEEVLKVDGVVVSNFGYNTVLPKTIKSYNPSPSELIVNAKDQDIVRVTAHEDLTIKKPKYPISGMQLTFVIIQNNNGNNSVTWYSGNGGFKTNWSNLGNTPNKRALLTFIYNGLHWEQVAYTTYL